MLVAPLQEEVTSADRVLNLLNLRDGEEKKKKKKEKLGGVEERKQRQRKGT